MKLTDDMKNKLKEIHWSSETERALLIAIDSINEAQRDPTRTLWEYYGALFIRALRRVSYGT